MTLAGGTQLGSYEILSLLGAGGMGEVYRARDSKLKREVAIKILPEQFSRDADRVSRFQREAEVLASLSHSNIAGIHELNEAAGSRFLVLELVEGETLADRLKQGAIPLDEALQIARQIAEALEAAHGKSVIHRDLKPANVKITPEGKVKVLDFGLAKMLEPETSPADFSKSPTLMSGTMAGVIIGTAAYMSPEQARGQATDVQSDIWAFGCVLYEMLTGAQTFSGETITDLLGGIVRVDPDWTALPPNTPQLIRLLLRQCLQKPRNTRLHHIGDARIQIDAASVDIAPPPAVAAAAPAIWRRPVIWIVAALLLMTIAAMTPFVIGYFRFASKEPSAIRFSVTPPEKAAFVSGSTSPYPSLSPDGKRLAFNAVSDGISRVWIRSLDSLDARPLIGTDGASNNPVFWSPDSRFIAFQAQGKLKKIEVAGGPAQTLCDTSAGVGAGFGGAWNSNGVILFDGATGVIQRISAAGGKPEPVTTLDASRKESSHAWPYFLQDGDHFLYLARGATPESNAIVAGSLTSKETKVIINANARVAFDRSGYLLFIRERSVMAQPFDARKLQTTGDAFPIAEQVRVNPAHGSASWSVSESGIFAYRTGDSSGNTKLTWFDRSGKALNTVGPIGRYANPELSPDGKRIAIERVDAQSSNADIWVIDLARDVPTRLTFDPAIDVFPIWSPDGIQIMFTRNASPGDMYLKPSSGAGAEELILKGDAFGRDWSADGKFVVYNSKNSTEIWTLPISGERKAVLYLTQSSFNKTYGKLSPDGRWYVYQSNESGRTEIYVQSFPNPSAKWQISNAGGITPRWRRDGKEIFYVAPDQKLMAVPVRLTTNSVEPSSPVPLFEVRVPGVGGPGLRQQYDVSADGQRFLVNTIVDETAEAPITVVLNWLSGIKK